jgi:xylulokinase
MGVTLSAGGSLNWWRRVLGEQYEYDALIELAASAPIGSEGLLFLPYLSGERTPHLDASARGAFFGLTARHGLNHMTRAVMEGVTYSLADCLQVMTELGVKVDQVRAVGGGARSDLWRQIQADVFGIPVRRTAVDEGPAYGAALLAGVTAGHFKSVSEASSVVRLRPDVAEPNPENARLYSRYLKVFRDLYPATASAMAELSDLASN